MRQARLLNSPGGSPLASRWLIAGCGGGGSSTSDTTQAKKPEKPAALSKASFISQGDGICGEVNSAVGAIDAKESEVSSYEQAAQVATLYTGMIERLTKLGTPSDTEGYAEFSEAAELFAKAEIEVKDAAEEENWPRSKKPRTRPSRRSKSSRARLPSTASAIAPKKPPLRRQRRLPVPKPAKHRKPSKKAGSNRKSKKKSSRKKKWRRKKNSCRKKKKSCRKRVGVAWGKKKRRRR